MKLINNSVDCHRPFSLEDEVTYFKKHLRRRRLVIRRHSLHSRLLQTRIRDRYLCILMHRNARLRIPRAAGVVPENRAVDHDVARMVVGDEEDRRPVGVHAVVFDERSESDKYFLFVRSRIFRCLSPACQLAG